jgi:DUF1680 family protein
MMDVQPKLKPAPLERVTIDDRFWAPRIETNRTRTLPAAYRHLKGTGRIDALKLTWKPGEPDEPHVFWDSDVAKWIEAASYSLAVRPDAELDALLDEVIGLIASGQQPDGYLNTHYSAVEPEKRWTNLRDRHELYCAGHLIEAAVAHFQATGKRTLLDVLCRYTDHIATVFGRGEGQKPGYPGHEEIELALVKLYRATGEQRYLRLSEYFVDERGRQPHYYDEEARARGDDPAKYWPGSYEYCQAHAPVREQSEIVGHAVRATYLYSAMADLAGELGDAALLAACERLWDSACRRRMYVTGGIGPSGRNEGFTFDYDLPNETAYAETCAAIGLIFWNHRMLQVTGEGRYADVMERALYNGAISGVSLDGERFFYVNPLTSMGRHHRQEWFGCACCPPNLARLVASLGQYVYSEGADEAVVHLFVQGGARLAVGGRQVTIRQETDYPWDGRVRVTVEPDRPARFRLKLRRPGWCAEAKLLVDGRPVEHAVEAGYLLIDREWSGGETVELELAMPVAKVYAHPGVRMDCGKVALQRGPIVYCLEEADNGPGLSALSIPPDGTFETRFEADLLGGVLTICGTATRLERTGWDGELYRAKPPARSEVSFTAVPYCTWDNRAAGEMLVWLRES